MQGSWHGAVGIFPSNHVEIIEDLPITVPMEGWPENYGAEEQVWYALYGIVLNTCNRPASTYIIPIWFMRSFYYSLE